MYSSVQSLTFHWHHFNYCSFTDSTLLIPNSRPSHHPCLHHTHTHTPSEMKHVVSLTATVSTTARSDTERKVTRHSGFNPIHMWWDPGWGVHISKVSSSEATDTLNVFSIEFSVICCTFEGHACVHMGVWNEGELTDGGGQVVSGQYHHGPTNPNIIWVLSCVLLCFFVFFVGY